MQKIITVPNKILSRKTQIIKKFDDELRVLINNMRETMISTDGVGLAAPQIGESIALAIVEIPDNSIQDKHISSRPSRLYVLINPKIIKVSSQKNSTWEGCLSIPEYEVDVSRPENIVIKAQDENGNIQIIKALGLLSRAFQHEIDHLNGILITDHGTPRKIKK